MPSQALTVILNYDHSKKFARLPSVDSTSRLHPKDAILREARNKFRSKALCIVYLRGGDVVEGDELPEAVEKVWVSKGEAYSGPPASGRSKDPGEVRVIRGKSFIDENAVKQLDQVAGLPGVRLAVGMPDLHPGSRFPIGCAIAAEGIYPDLIGSDVGCGIALYRLPSTSARSIANPSKLAGLLRGLDNPWSGSVTDWLAKYDIRRSSPFDVTSLGTVGAGNHFAEICTVEKIVDADVAGSLGVQDGGLYLLVHTGSRGLGASILANETADEPNPFIPQDSPHLDPYLARHNYAVRWAIANRDLVAHRIKQCIYSPSLDDDVSGESTSDSFELEKIVDVTHNSVTKHSLVVGDETKELWVHRKGAAPADQGVAPCPGSRGDFTWLLKPSGDGQFNAHSLAHGAGRRHGRAVLHTGAKINKATLTTTALGSEVICTDPDLLIEERPEAYKDVTCVVEDMEDQGVCQGVVVLRPVVTYKVREGASGVGEGRK